MYFKLRKNVISAIKARTENKSLKKHTHTTKKHHFYPTTRLVLYWLTELSPDGPWRVKPGVWKTVCVHVCVSECVQPICACFLVCLIRRVCLRVHLHVCMGGRACLSVFVCEAEISVFCVLYVCLSVFLCVCVFGHLLCPPPSALPSHTQVSPSVSFTSNGSEWQEVKQATSAHVCVCMWCDVCR